MLLPRLNECTRCAQHNTPRNLEVPHICPAIAQVERYALLEDMRLRHVEFKKAGKQALRPNKTEADPIDVPSHDSKDPMRIALKAKRARTGPLVEHISIETPPSPVPNVSQPNETVASSPPGMSLSSWMPPAGNNNTPQSLRVHPKASITGEVDKHAAPVSLGHGPQHQIPITQYGDDVLGYGSDVEDVEAYTDVEDEVLNGLLPPPPESVDRSAISSWAARFVSHSNEV